MKVLLFLVLLLSVCPLPSPALGRQPVHEARFLPDLVGSRKGDSADGIRHLRQYLERFGYLATTTNITVIVSIDFDDELETAIRTYQGNFHLNVTGEFDAATAKLMAVPRCGVPDIVHGVNLMQNGPNRGPRWAHLPGQPKWDIYRKHFQWAFVEGGGGDVFVAWALRSALDRWASVTDFTFEIISDWKHSDFQVGFFKLDHGDSTPFTGPGGTLAHAYPPPYGMVHFDADEKWSLQPQWDEIDVESVGLHEFGHMMGLGHSDVEQASMWPYFYPGTTKRELHPDDVLAIHALYP